MLFVITKYPLYLVELRPSDAMARNLASQCPSLKVLMSTKAPNWTRMSYPESRNPTKTEPQQTLSFRELFLIFSLSRFHIIYIGLSRRGLTRLLSARPPVHDHDEETLDTIDHECDLDAYCKGCKRLLPWAVYQIRELDGVALSQSPPSSRSCFKRSKAIRS